MTPLETLLDEVRAKVQVADFNALAVLAARLEAAATGLEENLPKVVLQRLRAKAEANTRFLDAARRGIKASRRRIEDAKRVTQGLQTYDVTGKRSDICTGTTTASRF